MSIFTASYFKDTELTTHEYKSIPKKDDKEGKLHSIDLSAHNVVKVEQEARHITNDEGDIVMITEITTTDTKGMKTSFTIFHNK